MEVAPSPTPVIATFLPERKEIILSGNESWMTIIAMKDDVHHPQTVRMRIVLANDETSEALKDTMKNREVLTMDLFRSPKSLPR